MGSIDLAEVFGAVIGVIELQHFMGRYYRVEIAEHEQNWEVGVESLHNCKVVQLEDVDPHLLTRSLLYEV